MYELKDGIPPPTGSNRYVTKYPFKDMKPGQHFDVPIDPREKPMAALCRVRMSAYKWVKKNPPGRISCRVDGDVVRVWRVE